MSSPHGGRAKPQCQGEGRSSVGSHSIPWLPPPFAHFSAHCASACLNLRSPAHNPNPSGWDGSPRKSVHQIQAANRSLCSPCVTVPKQVISSSCRNVGVRERMREGSRPHPGRSGVVLGVRSIGGTLSYRLAPTLFLPAQKGLHPALPGPEGGTPKGGSTSALHQVRQHCSRAPKRHIREAGRPGRPAWTRQEREAKVQPIPTTRIGSNRPE